MGQRVMKSRFTRDDVEAPNMELLEGLTEKQALFVHEVLASEEMNFNKAARKAGFSNHDALMKNTNVMIAIIEAIKKREARVRNKIKGLQIEGDRLLLELAYITYANIKDYYNNNGTIKRIDELTREQAAAVQSIKVKESYEGMGENRQLIGYMVELKLWDKQKAGDMAMRHLGMFHDNKHIREDKTITYKMQIEQVQKGIKGLSSEEIREQVAKLGKFSEEIPMLPEPKDKI